jgi:hypothetical protein
MYSKFETAGHRSTRLGAYSVTFTPDSTTRLSACSWPPWRSYVTNSDSTTPAAPLRRRAVRRRRRVPGWTLVQDYHVGVHLIPEQELGEPAVQHHQLNLLHHHAA